MAETLLHNKKKSGLDAVGNITKVHHTCSQYLIYGSKLRKEIKLQSLIFTKVHAYFMMAIENIVKY